MTTVLMHFYARALALAAFFVLVILLTAGVALAQDAAPAAAEPPQDIIGLVFSSLSAGAAALVVAILGVVTRHAPAWVVAIVDSLTTSEAVKWEDLLDRGFARAEAIARARFDPAKQRNDYVNAIYGSLSILNPEIVRFLDKDKNGVMDFIEANLKVMAKRVTPVERTSRKMEAIQ